MILLVKKNTFVSVEMPKLWVLQEIVLIDSGGLLQILPQPAWCWEPVLVQLPAVREGEKMVDL